ncbi:MAG TPA: hypothetical protein DEB12_07725 [Porphyromonadaceae bacterium]|jgi:glycosyltransferase involved in cell wall biosynthesis|nr:hypothetical protein [Porphyromonadaceae bacterium]
MRIVFLGGFYPKERYEEIAKRSKYLGFAANELQLNILRGFDSLGYSMNAITTPTTKKLKGLVFKGSTFSHNGKTLDHCIGFIDIVGLKHIHTFYKIKNTLQKHFNKIDYIFIYSLQSSRLGAAYFHKKANPETKIILIVTDLPQYMNDTDNRLYKILKSLEIKIENKFLEAVDKFVFLSDYMKEKISLKGKPYIVMEGIYNYNDGVQPNKLYNIRTDEDISTILYTGTIDRRFGVINLIKAFHTLKNERYNLIIAGDGDSKSEIEYFSAIDSRVKYLGVLDRNKILELQQISDLLVNPRTPEGEYVKYSFPSKTMEYFASGTPTLMYRLPGVPKEYYDYCYTISDLGLETLAKEIQHILAKPKTELKEMGDKARNFILTKKNPHVQCDNILKFMKDEPV